MPNENKLLCLAPMGVSVGFYIRVYPSFNAFDVCQVAVFARGFRIWRFLVIGTGVCKIHFVTT